MNCRCEIERESYRLIITRRAGSEILCTANGLNWSLPSLEIPSKHRLAEQLTDRLHAERGLPAYCLFVLNHSRPGRASISRTKFAVMEALEDADSEPVGCQWLPASGHGSHGLRPVTDRTAITEAIQEINTYEKDIGKGPFARLGWIRQLFGWIDTRIAPLGWQTTGAIRQLNASATFSLIRLETTGPAVWFKATGEPNLHELPISVLLARLFPEYVPKILGVHPIWNGWLAEEVSGSLLDDCQEINSWERAARTLAELQLASIDSCPELLANHCADFRLSRVVQLIDPFLARMADLMVLQVKRPPEPLTHSSLILLGRRLKEACGILERLGLPDALGHIDFNPGNIIVSPSRCSFLDWAEGCVTHPFATFEYLLEHARRKLHGNDAAVERITAAYFYSWESIFSADTLTTAKGISPLIAVYVAAVSDARWRSVDARADPVLAGYFRSLTRRMFREATDMAQQGEPCLR
jgi:hypothetical protein